MAIPFVFAPVRIGLCDYCDGGIVSNIPAWSLNDQMKLSPKAIMLLSDFPSYVESKDSPHPKPEVAPVRYFWNLVNSMLFGARHFEIQSDGHSYVASISTPLTTLSLEKSAAEFCRIYNKVTPLLQNHIEGLVRERKSMEQLCRDVHEVFLGFADGKGNAESLRVSALLPVSGDTTTLKRAYGWNSDMQSDSYTYISATEATMAGRVFTREQYELERAARPGATTWHEQKWVWMVPMMQGSACVGVMRIDSSDDHERFGLDRMGEEEVAQTSKELVDVIRSTLTALAASQNWAPARAT
jgi:hypothetical protein